MMGEKVYIALLRGVNVGGSKVILMADLKRIFEKLGFANVKTYIQSGNVVFSSAKRRTIEIEGSIKAAIDRRFGFDIGATVLGVDELEKMIKVNPFGEDKLKSGGRVHLTLLLGKPSKEKMDAVAELRENSLKNSHDGDDLEIIDRSIYVLCRNGWAKSPFNSSVTEKILKVDTTSRNLETMKKLAGMGRSLRDEA
jgi:uncharacterized protein (DUF1697 family)